MIITYPLNNIEYSSEDVETYLCTRKSGVYSANENFDISIVGDLSVEISPGIAWVNNGQFKGKSITSTEAVKLNLNPNYNRPTLNNNQVFIVAIRFSVLDNSSSIVVKGPIFNETVLPQRDESAYELFLYKIVVDANNSRIISNLTEDLRTNETYCGLMRDGVTSIPTSVLQEQYEETLESMNSVLENIDFTNGFAKALTEDVNDDELVNGFSYAANDISLKCLQNEEHTNVISLPKGSLLQCARTEDGLPRFMIIVFALSQDFPYDGYIIRNFGYDTSDVSTFSLNGSGGSVDLSDYYTKGEVDEKIGDVESLLEGI